MSEIETKIEIFCQHYPRVEYAKGTVILAASTVSPYFYYIEAGAVKMTRTSSKGKTLILHVFFPHSFFSLLSLIDHTSNDYDFVCVVPTTLRKIPQADLISWLKQNPDVLFEVQLRLLMGLQGLLNRIEQSNFAPAYNQVASLLLYFTKHFSATNPASTSRHKLTTIITHQEIAEWLGLSRENVSLQMKRLERENLIKTQDRLIEVINVVELKNRVI